jgi:hypothetical protein
MPYLSFCSCWLIVVTTLFCPAILQAQDAWLPKGVGTELGLSVGLSTHNSRIGVLARAFAHWDYVQINLELVGLYQAPALGTAQSGIEGQLRAGILGAWGPKNVFWESRFLSAVGNQTNRPYSLGYGFNCYWDNQNTSQCTGTFALQVRQFHLIMENDFLAFMDQDKYRTGALGLYFEQGAWQIALQQVSWTADPYAEGTSTVTNHPIYKDKAKYGYRAMPEVPYKGRSAGILRLRAVYHSNWANQKLGASLGIDAEQIRHGLQNKTIHDSVLLKNPHIPMIDRCGNAFLFEEGQQIRKARFHGELLLNPLIFY